MRYGTLSPKQLVEAAHKRGLKALVLTDINNTSCASAFVELCEQYEIKPILGIEFREENELLYIGIARNAEGFRELNAFLSETSLNGQKLPKVAPAFKQAYIIYERLTKPIDLFRANEFLGIRPEYIHRLFSSNVLKYRQKLVILNPVTFLDEDGYTVHKLLRAIDLNIVWTKLGKKDCAKANESFPYPDALVALYEAYPFLIKNTAALIESCSIEMPRGLTNNLQSFTNNRNGDFVLLEKLAFAGCKRRYGEGHRQALERVEKELKVIQKQGFCSYFLVTWDIVRYAETMGYHYVGRGSGANSIVAYCLKITDVDPLELDLYFERFINQHRKSPPDFDIDFSWDERDDVFDYIFKRYGREHTALLATYTTFKGKSIIRELGKVFGLPKDEIDKIVSTQYPAEELHELTPTLMKFGSMIKGFPNHLSIHAGGIVISERPIHYHTALKLMPKGFPIAHFDMYHAEDLGYHKFDVLSQRGLGHIKDAVALVKRNQGRAIDIHEVQKIMQDERVRAQLRSAKCMGCFYIESPAMRGLLTKLHCDNYKQLVAASSIIRPGVAKSGMMREYIKRFHEPYSFSYLHETFETHLGETYGIMVYQEDVMKIVHHFAGLDLDESDVLRRIMSGKKHKGDTFERLKAKYFKNCASRAYPQKLIDEVWRQIESFSGYSFCKAHSASYAVESFQSLYLKTYFPLEFMVAVINNFGGFYRTEYYVHEAMMAGGRIHATCVNHSEYLTTIEGKDIYLGFIHLHQMERTIAKRIIHQRQKNGGYQNLEDFINRVAISSEQLDILIRIGAFRFTGKSKYELMWEKNALYNPKEKFEASGLLFTDTGEQFSLPNLEEGSYDQAFDELELLGFALCSPFDLLEDKSIRAGTIRASHLKQFLNRQIDILGYYVCKKDVRTSNHKLMNFGTWLDADGHFFDTTHFPNFLKRHPFRGKGIYKIRGKVVEEFGFPSIEVIQMEKLGLVKDERY